MVTQWVRRGRAGHDAPSDPAGAGAPAVADGSTAALDVALRHLVHACREARRPLPAFPFARVRGGADDGVVALHLDAPVGPPPSSWEERDGVWWCHLDALGDVPPAPAAYPAVVPVGAAAGVGAGGAGDGGDSVWVDLGLVPGLVTVEAPEEQARAVLADIGAALRRLPWATQVRVVEAEELGGIDDVDAAVGASRVPVPVPVPMPVPVPVLGGVDGRWGPPPRVRHEVVLLSRPATPESRARVRAVARRRNAPTVLAPVRPGDAAARGVWNWRLEGEVVTW